MRSEPGYPPEIETGSVAWAVLEPVKGREQGGHRPVLVVSSPDYLETVTTLAIIVPITTVDRGWPNDILIRGDTGLTTDSWAMTEQLRTVSRDRLTRVSGRASAECMAAVRLWIGDFLDLPSR